MPNLGDLSPDPFGEASLSLAKAPFFSLRLQWPSLSYKEDSCRAGMDSAPTWTPFPWHTHTHTDTRTLPPLLPPGDVTLLLVGSLIPFLTF